MKVLHLLSSGGIGGIEVLCKDIQKNSNWDNYFSFIFKGGEIVEEIIESEGKVYDTYKLQNCFLKIKQLVKICKQEKIDIICVHHAGISIQLYYIFLKLIFPSIKGVRFLHSVFEKKYYYNSNILVNFIKKYTIIKSFNISDKIIGVSYAVMNSFKNEFNIEKDKISVVHNGIDESIMINGSKNEVDINGKINILFIGRIVEEKGISLLIEAMNKLKNIKNVNLTIVGDGQERENCEKMVDQYNLNENIEFVGFQRNLDKYLKRANIFVYPSICKEAFGISIVEAMAYGLPCVANKTGGIPEIIIDGKNGYLSTSNDVKGLCQGLIRAVECFEKNDINKISENAKETAHKFTIKNTVHMLRDEFEKLID